MSEVEDPTPAKTDTGEHDEPMTAAAARICRPTSLTDEIRARRSAWTPPGIVVNGDSGSARASMT